jgi:hypothetical protein
VIVDVGPQIHDLTRGDGNALRLSALLDRSNQMPTMPKRDNISAGRRPAPGASPVGAGRGHSAGATSVVTFTALSEAQWQAILLTRKKWPEGTDWRREIEQIGRDYWERLTTRKMWVKKLQGKQPAKQRKKIEQALVSIRQSQKALAELVNDGLLDDDFPHPDFNLPEQRLEAWFSDYDVWVRPFVGKSDPIKAQLELQLTDLWKRSGGELSYSRKKEKGPPGRRVHTGRGAAARDDQQDHADAERPNTPYAPLVDFLKLTLSAILDKALRPSGIAKLIDRNRGSPWRMYARRARIAGLI